MKDRKTAVLGGVFFFLLAVYIIISINPPERSRGARPLFPRGLSEVDRIEIAPPNSMRTVLEKIDGVWQIIEPFNFRASDLTVENTLQDFRNTVVDGVFSDRREIHDQYSVGDSTGISFKLYSSGRNVFDALVGKHTVDASHIYARMRGSNDIVLWRGIAAVNLRRNPDAWRDRTIYNYHPEDVISLKTVRGNITRELVLNEQEWVFTENGRSRDIDQRKAWEYVAFISTLQCEGFADEHDIPRVIQKRPDMAISFTIRNGDTHSIDIWIPSANEDYNRYLARKENGDIVYRLVGSGPRLVLDYDNLRP